VAIDRETVRAVAELAELELSEDELERMRVDLGRILDYAEKLRALDTAGVEPTSHVLELATPLRPDRVEGVLPVEEAVRNAPAHERGAMVVPKVLE
jgi:aspartyl-tRNA(Asn)/glutamyl-tRNA(Gln) amidotransferase subunit C